MGDIRSRRIYVLGRWEDPKNSKPPMPWMPNIINKGQYHAIISRTVKLPIKDDSL